MNEIITQSVGMPTYVDHITGKTYCGDKTHPDDYDVTTHLHPFDGKEYTYHPETQSWSLNEDAEWDKVRIVRDEKINNFQWKINRQRDWISAGIATAESLLPLLDYVQALRDIPQTQSDPLNVIWPTEPE
jgi:hypothetical protein